jgi:hypothetical protein
MNVIKIGLFAFLTTVLVVVYACSDNAKGNSDGGSAGDSDADSDADSDLDSPTCEVAELGGSETVAEPELVATLFDSWHESWLGSPAVVDLDGDGTKEILAPRSGLMLGWHLDGEIVFSAETEGRIWASPVVADLLPDNDGLEVAVASRDKIYAWDCNGDALPGFPVTWEDEMRAIAAGDINGNGYWELVAVTTTRIEASGQRDIIIAVDRNGNVIDGFPPNTTGASGCDDHCYVTGGYDQTVALGDLNADGAYDIFSCQDNAYMSLHDGTGFAYDLNEIFPNAKFPGLRFLHDYDLAQQGWANDEETANQAHTTNSAPAIADVDGNGTYEIIVLASVQNASQTDRLRGVALWVLNTDGTRPTQWVEPFHASDYLAGLWDYDGTNIVAATNQVTVANIDPAHEGPEFVFAGFDGCIHAVSASNEQLWQYTYTTDDRVLTGGVLAVDLSGDGIVEIVFSSYSPDEGKSHLFVLSASGEALHQIPLPDRGAMAVPTIADVDGDGVLEIVVNLKDAVTDDRQVQVYTVPGSSENCLLWATGRANNLRNGYVP